MLALETGALALSGPRLCFTLKSPVWMSVSLTSGGCEHGQNMDATNVLTCSPPPSPVVLLPHL